MALNNYFKAMENQLFDVSDNSYKSADRKAVVLETRPTILNHSNQKASDSILNENNTTDILQPTYFSYDDKFTQPGIFDAGNLLKFAPYETGYCFLAVISAPRMMCYNSGGTIDNTTYNALLQRAFITGLETEFKGLDGIEDITSETVDITDGISTLQLINKVNQQSAGQFSMRFNEKVGTLYTKYISTYLKLLRDPRTLARTYGGAITKDNVQNVGPWDEVFNFLYVITDSTCLRVEKAFLLLNAQFTTAAYSELYNMEKGNIENKEITTPFNAYIVDGALPNKLGKSYVEAIINLTSKPQTNKINLNSSAYNWSFAVDGEIRKIGSLKIDDKYNTSGVASTSSMNTTG